jgi:hypothetical protein
VPTEGIKILSKEKLVCTPIGDYKKCMDETLNIEFEHPAVWGDIEAVLRTGWDSGYAYKYSFHSATISDAYLPETGGLSIDFAEGRDQHQTDFAGFGNSGLPADSCEDRDLYPICNDTSPDVKWMIRFPNAKYFCEVSHRDTSPVFRIEINLPDNPTINGFVFIVPFLSEPLYEEIKKDIYSLFLKGPEMMPSYPEACYPENRQPFDEEVKKFIERLQARSLDAETLMNLDDLIHLAGSITLNK